MMRRKQNERSRVLPKHSEVDADINGYLVPNLASNVHPHEIDQAGQRAGGQFCNAHLFHEHIQIQGDMKLDAVVQPGAIPQCEIHFQTVWIHRAGG